MTLYPNILAISSFNDPQVKPYIAKGSFYFHIKDSVFKTVCHAGYGIEGELISRLSFLLKKYIKHKN